MSELSTVTVLFLGPMELGLVLAIVVLLFGAKKIPKLARSSGEALGEFKKGRQEMEDEIQQAKDDVGMQSGVSGPDPREEQSEPSVESEQSAAKET